MIEGVPGDILLYPVTPQSALASRLIAIGELLWRAGKGTEEYSHCAIVSDIPGHQYEAKWPKTGLYKRDPKRPFEIWTIVDITSDQRNKILEWCSTHEGEWYDLPALFFGLFQFKHSEVCSQFVGEAYEYGNIKFDSEGKRLLTPNALADSKLAKRVWP